jgi:hypothetical protein
MDKVCTLINPHRINQQKRYASEIQETILHTMLRLTKGKQVKRSDKSQKVGKAKPDEPRAWVGENTLG